MSGGFTIFNSKVSESTIGESRTEMAFLMNRSADQQKMNPKHLFGFSFLDARFCMFFIVSCDNLKHFGALDLHG